MSAVFSEIYNKSDRDPNDITGVRKSGKGVSVVSTDQYDRISGRSGRIVGRQKIYDAGVILQFFGNVPFLHCIPFLAKKEGGSR